jgi:glycosyltransferase involved in cell wall biosynthesis
VTSSASPASHSDGEDQVRVLAFYRLPDPSPGSDPGREAVAEWAPVRAARPAFVGHEQPQLPGEFGYCDVRDPRVREAHAALAREYTIAGFCYVFQAPTQVSELDPTLAAIISSGRPQFPFCVCWETTTMNAGAGFDPDNDSGQRRFTRDESIAVVRSLIEVFADERYVRIGERPLFIVSSPDPIADVRSVATLWRQECEHAGVGNPYIACYGAVFGADPQQVGFDAIVECPPLGGFPRSKRNEVIVVGPEIAGDVRSYRSYVGQLLTSPRPRHVVFRTVMPGWDETARAGSMPKIFVDSNPETFSYWTERALDQTHLRFSGDERLLFVRSWNEWSAGCHIEPGARHGRRYLEALRAAVARAPTLAPPRPSWETMRAWVTNPLGFRAARVVRSQPTEAVEHPGPYVSVVMPAYNHERYVQAALDSVLTQTHRNLEIIVVDDGSRDATPALLDQYAERCRSHSLTVVHQVNAGAHEAINHGLALARGEIIALMNSDDLYTPTRLERLLREMDRHGQRLAFSNTRFIDDEGREIPATDPYPKQLRRAIEEATQLPEILYVLVYSNIAMSTGNLVFRRELLEQTGGFCAMRVCHDWDFILAASQATGLAFVDEPLYEYRLHGGNTFSGSRTLAAFELEQMLSRFFSTLGDHRIAHDPAELERFLGYIREIGLDGYLPQHTV